MKKIKLILKILLAILALLLLFGCGPAKEITEIKPVVIHPPVIEDTIKAAVKTDTVIVGIDIVKNDTITIVKYFPKLEKFYIKAKPDSILVMDTITTTQTIEKLVETPFLAKMGLVFIGFVLALVVLFYFIRK